jgi:hypothetical protein
MVANGLFLVPWKEGADASGKGALQLPIIKLLLTDQAGILEAIIPFPTPFYA